MRYSIVTPTILRESLVRLCESIDSQTSKDWEHIVVVDTQISNDVIVRIAHPRRTILRCEQTHGHWGHHCRHGVYPLLHGDYVWYVDDDNYLADENVLKDLEAVFLQWAVFPINRFGERFFSNDPGLRRTDTGSFIVKREVAQWPDLPFYDTDGRFVEELKKKYKFQNLGMLRPLLFMPTASTGEGHKIEVRKKLKISLFTPAHTNTYLREAYESIKNQDFDEWVIVFNNGGVPTDFGDKRVKPQVLYKAPEMVGPLKAYACEKATGDVLVEFDNDDLLAPNAIEEIRKAFEDSEIGFAYSNTIHVNADCTQREKFSEVFGWKYRPASLNGNEIEELVAFDPTPESISRIWYAPDHVRAFRRLVYQQVGGYDPTLKILDDGDLIIRMYLATKFKRIDLPLYVYRVHGANAWLKFNKEIQDGVYPLYDKYIDRIVSRWAELRGLPVIDLAKERDLQVKENSVGVFRSVDTLAKIPDPLNVMKSIYRALVPGGWLLAQVPSTDGRGAFQDPRNVSFWNENSFGYYTSADKAQYIDTPVRFQAVRLYTTEKNNEQVCWTVAHLVSLKEGYRPAGPVLI